MQIRREELIFYSKSLITSVFYGVVPALNLFRPHDRVTLKEMKVDWRACLNNKVGFKV